YDRKIDNIAKDIEKEIATKHRPTFKEGFNNVKTQLDLLNSDIEKLDKTQYETLTDIIKSNASKFRTKISRAMIKDKSKKFNYKKTMQNSLKTSGLPIELFYEKPKIKKTKIVCILDVSGSCAKSSKLLLRFIYELSNVFKGGVKSYAFIRELSDISDFFINYHINDAIEESLKSVTRTYSDYYTALKMFNDSYLGEIDKSTVVIFLGDARNNKNKPGTEFLSNIQRKAKSTIWLNTEEKPKWNVNDSIIGIYSEYMNEVHEILTTNDIIQFLENFKLD
ncbi:MAG: VWA domain-containing protein, partial [Romboutsia sp.]|nr:VWA domain-containing protein [Romboutsia sp.]